MTINLASQAVQIHQEIIQHGGYLPVQSVQKILGDNDITIDQLLSALLPICQNTSVSPISHFKVGAVVLGETGNLYVGANQEYVDMPLDQAVHAEQAAVAMAHRHGETSIVKIAASENPCGCCRQFLNELNHPAELEVLLTSGKLSTLSQLLPHGFGPKSLGMQGGLLTSQQDFHVAASDELTQQALKAINKSYSPYAKSWCGVALQTENGRIFSGSYLENAAFNPGLPAMQAAFVHLIQSGAQFANVRRAVLLQVKNAIVDHAAVAEILLRAVCPQAELQITQI